jgi:hypothetical protein
MVLCLTENELSQKKYYYDSYYKSSYLQIVHDFFYFSSSFTPSGTNHESTILIQLKFINKTDHKCWHEFTIGLSMCILRDKK